jgi:D-cysteine desulfhydrase
MMTAHNTERISLGTFPTPLQPASRLAAAIGLRADRLWIKRDDLTGLGGGGNKVRKLERTLAAALRDGEGPEGNLLDEIFGARIRWAGDADDLGLAAVADEAAAELASFGAHPAVIPFGGSNRDGALAYADAARELRDQLADQLRDLLGDRGGLLAQLTSVVAVGSGGTMAGLVAELGPERVLGVHTGAVAAPGEAVAALACAITAESLDPQTLRIRTDQVGVGYGRLTEATAAAIRLTARAEGIVLDPTYTGRAMAGLIAAVRDGDLDRDAPVVFWHTGGLPGLFGHPEAATIPGSLVP